jgi:hypothetical protein
MDQTKKLATIKDLIQNKELFDAEQQDILAMLAIQTNDDGEVLIFKTGDGKLDPNYVLNNDEELSSEYLDGLVEQRNDEYGEEDEDGAHIIEELKQMRQQLPSLWGDKRLHLNRALRESVIPDDVIKSEIKPYLAGSRRKRKRTKKARKRTTRKRTARKRTARKRTTRKRT